MKNLRDWRGNWEAEFIGFDQREAQDRIFANQTAKNARNAKTTDKRNVDSLLWRAASCDQANLRMTMKQVDVISGLPHLFRRRLEIFHRFSFAFSAFSAVDPIWRYVFSGVRPSGTAG